MLFFNLLTWTLQEKKLGMKISMWKIASIKVYAAMASGFMNNKDEVSQEEWLNKTEKNYSNHTRPKKSSFLWTLLMLFSYYWGKKCI